MLLYTLASFSMSGTMNM